MRPKEETVFITDGTNMYQRAPQVGRVTTYIWGGPHFVGEKGAPLLFRIFLSFIKTFARNTREMRDMKQDLVR